MGNMGLFYKSLFTTKLPFHELDKVQSLMSYSDYPIHLHPDWLTTYIDQMAISVKPMILVIGAKSKEKAIGILPLEIKTFRGTRFFSMRRLQPLGTGPSDFFDISCVPGKEIDTAKGIVQWLFHHPLSWDSLLLNLIPASSPVWEPLIEELNKKRYKPVCTSDTSFFYTETSGSWEAFTYNFFAKRNRDLLKDLRKIERSGILLHLVEIEKGISNYLPACFDLYAQRRETNKQKNPFSLPDWQNFLYCVIKKFEEKGLVILSLLKDENNEIWAYQLDWRMNGIRYHYSHAYNEKYAVFSPGKILLYYILKNSFADPNTKECNFMRGESSYKRNFANESERYVTIQVENPFSIRVKFLHIARKIYNLISRL